MTAWLLWCGLTAAAAPSEPTIVYYNARMALREGEPLEAVKLWLLRNAVEDLTGQLSPHDADFHSVTWAALGELGICQDGHATDEDGAGLWPLALHNWVVRNMGRRVVKSPRPFRAFEVGRQARFVSINDVLSTEELKTVELSRGRCVRPRLALLSSGETVTADLNDRQVAARLLQHLLRQARSTLDEQHVRGWAVIEARLFDLDLQLAALAAREARDNARDQARKAREAGLSRESLQALRDDAPLSTLPSDSEPARVLQACVQWPASEWMALSPERRLFLFDHARAYGGDPEALDAIALGVIDALIADGEGEQVDLWIPRARDPEAIWRGERGARLLTLDHESGFGERSVIALHRGVQQLQGGDLSGALRSMAYALTEGPDSRASEDVHSLSRRWLSYVASQFQSTHELLVTLQELVPARDYSMILEDLMWRAALRADRASFETGITHQVGRGALERRLELLDPLASGDVGGFATRIRTGLSRSPSETLRFLDQLVQRLELEEAEVRAAHWTTLTHVHRLVEPLAVDGGRGGRTATALLGRTQAILEGLGGLADASARDQARTLAPGSEVFAGSLRLAPADPLPWPFAATEVAPPSVFDPLTLTPEEWRDDDGEWVLGWSIGG